MLKEEKGFTLIGVMLVLSILSVLGLSMAKLSYGSVKVSSGERDDQSAYYIAEAGLTYEMGLVENSLEDIFNATSTEEDFYNLIKDEFVTTMPQPSDLEFAEFFGEEPTAEIMITELDHDNPRTYNIVSTGIIGNKERTLSQEFSVGYTPATGGVGYVPDMALFVEETIEMHGGPAITGDIGTIKAGPNTVISTGGSSVDGSIFVPIGSEAHAIYTDIASFPPATGKNLGDIPSLPDFPTFPTYFIPEDKIVTSADGYNSTKVIDDGHLLVTNWLTENYTLNMHSNLQFKSINIYEDNTLTINTGNSDKEIVVDRIYINNGHLKIEGTGKLTIYVKDEIDFNRGSINEDGDVNQLNIYLQGTSPPKTIDMSHDFKINGSLYAENANIKMSGGSGFLGNIFTGGTSFEISGGNSTQVQLIFAPNADFELKAGGHIKGSVIAKSFYMDGGTSLKYEPLDIIDGPISPGIIVDEGEEGGFELIKQPAQEKTD